MPIVALAWLMLAAYCALYTGAFLMVVSAIWKPEQPFASNRSRPAARYPEAIFRVLLIPMIWVGFEYIRSTLLSGFPWNTLGVSQYRNTATIQVAEWGGVYAVSFLVMLMNCGLGLTGMNIVDRWRKSPGGGRRIHVELMTAFAIVIVCMSWGIRRSMAFIADPDDIRTLRVALIQGNIPQNEKWTEESSDAIYHHLEELTLKSLLSDPDLIIWPETAVPHPVMQDSPTGEWIGEFAKQGSPLLVGTMVVESNETRERIYNSALLFDRQGDVAGEYRKRHLVPFGEYIPLDRHFAFLQRIAPLGYSCTPGTHSTVFHITSPQVAFSTLICFEDTLAGLGRASVRNGAELLVNQTNDAWFEDTSAAIQHMSHCVFRCVENRVPAVRCANMGVSCLISPAGIIDKVTQDLLRQGEGTDAEFRVDNVVLAGANSRQTFYTRYGDIPFAIPCAIISAVYLALLLVKGRQSC
jgi:apolipoprotein N-acyltransferase